MNRKLVNTLELYIRLTYLVMFIVSFMFYQKLSSVYKIFTILVVIDLAFLLFKNYRKKYYDSKLVLLLMMLLFTHFITAIVNYHENFFGNMVEIVFMFSYCFIGLIYNENTVDKIFKMYSYFIQGATFVISVIVTIFLAMNVTIVLSITENKQYFLGIIRGRIWPLLNPNSMAGFSYTAIVLALILINMKKNKRHVFLKINIFLQFVFLSIVQSRGAFLTCSVMIILYVLFVSERYKVWYKKLIQASLSLIVFVGLIFLINVGASIALSNTLVDSSKTIYVDNNLNYETFDSKKRVNSSKIASVNNKKIKNQPFNEKGKHKNKQLQMRLNNTESSGRVYIWKKAFVMIKDKPLFGYGVRNIQSHFPKGLDETIIHNLNFHNIFLNVWVSAGLLSLLVFIIVLVYLSIRFLKYLMRGQDLNAKLIILLFFGMLAGQFFESSILYVTSFFNIFFWFVAGYGMYLINKKSKKMNLR